MGSLEKPIVAITIGEASGIGPEIVLKALAEGSTPEVCRPLVIGDRNVMQRAREAFRSNLEFSVIPRLEEAKWAGRMVNLLDLNNIPLDSLAIGHPDAVTGKAMVEYAELAVRLCMEGKVHGAVGGPHSKKAVHEAGIPFDGYPGFVARMTGSKYPFMMLVAGTLRITNVTLHVSLRKALDLIKKDLILEAIKATYEAVKTFGVSQPKIAVAALNPHAGEGGMFGNEDDTEIKPAIIAANQLGMAVVGPLPADTVFCGCMQGPYDAYIGMYHDQAHLPIKVLAFEKTSGVPIGVPVNFATVGHGCASDIAWKGIADPTSLIETIKLVSRRAKPASAAVRRAG
jgi:4-hydroxythreonine-4-phosphate dehydrogenase